MKKIEELKKRIEHYKKMSKEQPGSSHWKNLLSEAECELRELKKLLNESELKLKELKELDSTEKPKKKIKKRRKRSRQARQNEPRDEKI